MELLVKLGAVQYQKACLTKACPRSRGEDVEVRAEAPEGARATAYCNNSRPPLQLRNDDVKRIKKLVRDRVLVCVPKFIEIDDEDDKITRVIFLFVKHSIDDRGKGCHNRPARCLKGGSELVPLSQFLSELEVFSLGIPNEESGVTYEGGSEKGVWDWRVRREVRIGRADTHLTEHAGIDNI